VEYLEVNGGYWCGGTAPKLAAVPALSVPAVLCWRDFFGRLDGLDDHLAAIVVSHAE
jgi:hypothetical protein